MPAPHPLRRGQALHRHTSTCPGAGGRERPMLQNTRGPDGNGGEGGKKGTLLVKENRPGVCDGVNGGRGVPPPSAEPSQWRPLSKESSGELPSQSPSHGSQWQGAAALNSTVFVPHTRSTLRGGGLTWRWILGKQARRSKGGNIANPHPRGSHTELNQTL